MPELQTLPNLLRRICIPEQPAVLFIDNTFIHQEIDIDSLPPERLPHQHYRQWLYLPGLDQGESFKQLIKGAVAAGERKQGPGTQHEMHFAQGKVVKVEREIRRYIGVGCLLMREDDVEAD
mgnify:CR=1 FL=1